MENAGCLEVINVPVKANDLEAMKNVKSNLKACTELAKGMTKKTCKIRLHIFSFSDKPVRQLERSMYPKVLAQSFFNCLVSPYSYHHPLDPVLASTVSSGKKIVNCKMPVISSLSSNIVVRPRKVLASKTIYGSKCSAVQ